MIPLALIQQHFPNAARWLFYAYVGISSTLVALCAVTLFLESKGLDGGYGTCSVNGSPELTGFCRYLLAHRGDLAGMIVNAMSSSGAALLSPAINVTQ